MGDFEPIEIEYLMNNQQLATDAARAEQTLTGVSDHIQQQCDTALGAIRANITRMTQELDVYRQRAAAADPLARGGINTQIQTLEASIGRLRHQEEDLVTPLQQVGTTGTQALTQVGEAAGRSTNYFKAAWSAVRQLAYALPGIGVAGIIGFAAGPVFEFIKALVMGTNALDSFTLKMQMRSKIQEDAIKLYAKEISHLNILKTVLTDSTTSHAKRNDAIADYNKLADASNQIDKTAINNYAVIEKAINKQIELIEKRALATASENVIAEKAQALLLKQFEFRDKYPRYTDEEIQALDQKAFDAINKAAAKLNVKNVNPAELLAQSLLPDSALKEMAAQDNRFAILVDAGTAKILKEVNARKRQIEAIRSGNTQGYAGVKVGLDDIAQAKKELDAAIDAGKGFIQGSTSAPNKQQIAKEENDLNALLREQLSLRERIREFTNRNEVKALDTDQAALTAISDQFSNLKFQIEKANTSYDAFVSKFGKGAIDRFNANPANTTKLSKTDASTLKPIQDAALSNQADLNENKFIQLDLEKKKQLYAEYEKYRQRLGSETADMEYADLLQSGQTFQLFVETMQKSLTDQQGDLSPAAFEQRKKLYEKYAQDIQKDQAGFNLSMLAESLTFEQRSNVIIDTTLRKAAALRKAGYADQAEIVMKQGEAELDLLNLQNIETVASYKTLANSLIGATKEQADFRIQSAKATADADRANGKISEAAYERIIELINQAKATVASNTIVNGLDAMAAALAGIAQSAADLDENLSNTINDISKSFALVAKLSSDINKLQSSVQNYQKNKADAGGGFLGTVSTIANMIPIVGSVISGVISAVSGVVKFFKAAKETAIQSAAELLRYQNSLVTGEITYNELLRERAAAIKDINDLTLQQLQLQQKLLAGQTQQAQADFDRLLSLIQGQGQQITGEHTEKYGGFLGIAKKTKVVQDLAGLGGADYDQLEKLYTEGKLVDGTKQWFEQLQKVHGEIGNIGDTTDQVNEQLKQIFTGTTADTLEQAIINGLKAGKRGFKDFSEDFGTSIQDAITSTFESGYLKDKASAYYEEFAKLSESNGGLSKDEITQLQKDYATLINGASTTYQDLFKVTGQLAPTSAASGGNTLSGAIKGITEDQANILEGVDRGIQLAVVKTNDLLAATAKLSESQLAEMQKQTLVQMEIAVNTKRTADNTDVLPTMRDSLKSIDKNTADTTGALLRGAGTTKTI